MRNILNENIVCIDVDDTLLMWKGVTWKANYANINALIREKKRGKYIIVWSKAGGKAARIAVRALGIQVFVDLTMAKPGRIIDDKDPGTWLHRSYYKGDETNDG